MATSDLSLRFKSAPIAGRQAKQCNYVNVTVISEGHAGDRLGQETHQTEEHNAEVPVALCYVRWWQTSAEEGEGCDHPQLKNEHTTSVQVSIKAPQQRPIGLRSLCACSVFFAGFLRKKLGQSNPLQHACDSVNDIASIDFIWMWYCWIIAQQCKVTIMETALLWGWRRAEEDEGLQTLCWRTCSDSLLSILASHYVITLCILSRFYWIFNAIEVQVSKRPEHGVFITGNISVTFERKKSLLNKIGHLKRYRGRFLLTCKSAEDEAVNFISPSTQPQYKTTWEAYSSRAETAFYRWNKTTLPKCFLCPSRPWTSANLRLQRLSSPRQRPVTRLGLISNPV